MIMQRAIDRQKIRQIKGVSDLRRLPRLGKIRLGIKKLSRSGQEYPVEADCFVCPPEVQKVYGEKPKELRIMFPVDDATQIFPQAYKWYAANAGLKCKGDGETAIRRCADLEEPLRQEIGGQHDDNELVEIPCSCFRLESGECSEKRNLMVILPDVNLGGVYQIDTGSFYNIVELNSTIDYLKALLGRIALIPLTLRREAVEIPFQGKRRTHYLLKLIFAGDLATVQRIREQTRWLPSPRFELPEPTEDGPEPIGPTQAIEEELLGEAPSINAHREAEHTHNEVAPEHGEAERQHMNGESKSWDVWAELAVFLARVKVAPDPERAGDVIPYPEVAPGLDRWLRMEFKLSGGFEDLKAAAPDVQAAVLLRMKTFTDVRSFLLKVGGRERSG